MSVLTLEAALHARWADATVPDAVVLNALLPVAKVVTGTMMVEADDSQYSGLPFCTINREGNVQDWQNNCGSVDKATMRFQVWHEDHAAGMVIRQAILDCFDGTDFIYDKVSVINMQKANDFALQEDDGVWQILIDFSVTHQILSGA